MIEQTDDSEYILYNCITEKYQHSNDLSFKIKKADLRIRAAVATEKLNVIRNMMRQNDLLYGDCEINKHFRQNIRVYNILFTISYFIML